MPVSSDHPSYADAAKKWELTRAIIDNNAQKWLPDADDGDPLRNQRYKNDAILTNFTALTRNGLLGLIFLNAPKSTLPPELNYLYDNASGSGLSLDQLTQQICSDLLETGRYGLLVDCIEDSTARIVPYTAESIRNWNVERVNGRYQFSLVVLKESITVQVTPDDIYNLKTQDQYRVLRFEDGIYIQEVYDKLLNRISRSAPTKADGTFFDKIPFVIIGTENNDAAIDNAILYDLAVLNLGQYRNSADYEESIFVCGQPTIVVNTGDMQADQWLELNGGKFKFGSRGGHIVGLGGNAILLQANANQLAAQAIRDKLLEAVGIGARIISPPGGRETAEAARIRFSSQNSALFILTKNINAGIEEAIEICCEFTQDADPSIVEYELNDQFYEDGTDVTLLAQAILMFDRNIVSAQEIRKYIETSGAGLVLESDVPDDQNSPV